MWVFISVFGMSIVICVAIIVIMIIFRVSKVEVPMTIYYFYCLIVQQSFCHFTFCIAFEFKAPLFCCIFSIPT